MEPYGALIESYGGGGVRGIWGKREKMLGRAHKAIVGSNWIPRDPYGPFKGNIGVLKGLIRPLRAL